MHPPSCPPPTPLSPSSPPHPQAATYVFLSVGLEVAFGGWTTVYATKWLSQSEADGHALTSAYWGAFTAGRLIASAAAAVLRPATLLLVSMPLAVLGAKLALALPPARLAGPLATTSVILVGLGVSTGFANMLALLERHAPITGSVTGLLGAVAGAGTMLMPVAIALLAKETSLGYQGLMWVTLASMVLQFVCLAPVLIAGRRSEEERRRLALGRDVSIPGSEWGGGSGGAGGAEGEGEQGREEGAGERGLQ